MVERAAVEMAFRLILGKEPDEDPAVVDRLARRCATIADLRAALIGRPAVRKAMAKGGRVAEDGEAGEEDSEASAAPAPQRVGYRVTPISVELDAPPDLLDRMVGHVEATWQRLGEERPHHSVLTNPAFAPERIAENEERFFAKGRSDVARMRLALERAGVAAEGLRTCFELGCGVGRLTVWLAELFEGVTAGDISAAHLAEASRTLERFGRANVRLVHLGSLAAVRDLRPFDMFFSVIVLQHNPPPVQRMLLETILGRLNPGGVAYFQIPTWRRRYSFRISDYVARLEAGTEGAEMHAMPQHLLFDLLRRAGCELLDIREGNRSDKPMVSNTLLARKAG